METLMQDLIRAAYKQDTVNIWPKGSDPIHGHIIGIHGDIVTLLDHNLDLNRHVQVSQISTFYTVGA